LTSRIATCYRNSLAWPVVVRPLSFEELQNCLGKIRRYQPCGLFAALLLDGAQGPQGIINSVVLKNSQDVNWCLVAVVFAEFAHEMLVSGLAGVALAEPVERCR
jgi:hypothetical protein